MGGRAGPSRSTAISAPTRTQLMANYLPAYARSRTGQRQGRSRCRTSPTRSSSTTARTCSRNTASAAEDLGRDDGRRRKKIMDGEKNAQPAGLLRPPARRSRAPSAPTSCRFGASAATLTDKNGKLNLDAPQAQEAVRALGRTEAGGRAAARTSPRSRPTASARTSRPAICIFAMNWGYVWNRLENDADTRVKGKIGVVPLPRIRRRTRRRPASAAGSSRCRPSPRTRPRR